MQNPKVLSTSYMTLLKWVAAFLVLKVLFSILLNYRDYFPPNFNSDFLLDRRNHFFGLYAVAFYTHIVSTPFALLTGLLLINQTFRSRYPYQHRWIGKVHILVVLFLVVPSSIWMSAYAFTGWIAGAGFAALSLTTGLFAALGWRRARQRDFNKHRYWMTRCFTMLCSAVVLRIYSGTATLMQAESFWTYPIGAWCAWIVPLFVLQLWEYSKNGLRDLPNNRPQKN